jgi:hypothetical protein
MVFLFGEKRRERKTGGRFIGISRILITGPHVDSDARNLFLVCGLNWARKPQSVAFRQQSSGNPHRAQLRFFEPKATATASRFGSDPVNL